jgi:hypothetical protein
MRDRLSHVPAFLLMLSLLLALMPQQPAAAQPQVVGGVNILSVLPKKICVGDTITLNGAASITNLEEIPPPLAWLPVTVVRAKAKLGRVSPDEIVQYNDGFYFDMTYKATTPGMETITLTVNDTVAVTEERFEVTEKCDYDAFLTEVMYFSADLGDELFRSITHVTGMGTMKRDREGTEFYQGEGTWHLEENVLSKPSMCVQYYSPPLITQGPFELDGRLEAEGESVDVILSFLPKQGQLDYHGKTICVDADGETGYGESWAQGGDSSMASKIEATFLSGGGTQTVELKGAGIDIVQSVGNLDYSATLTLIPH